MARNYREQYILLNRMTSRKPRHHQFWQNWGDSSKQPYRWLRPGRRNDCGSEKRRGYWHDDVDVLIKKIEADPYTFLFGKSNEYLQLPRSWSSFCRSFLYPEGSPEHTRKTTSSAEQEANRSSVSDESQKAPFVKVESDHNVLRSYATSSRNEHLHFDPISGRMIPTKQETTRAQQVKAKGDTQEGTSIKSYTESGGANHERNSVKSKRSSGAASLAQADESQASNSNVLYMAGPTEDASVTPEDKLKSTTDAKREQEISQKPNIGQKREQKRHLNYDLEEVKEDDVDLLRASDIRASFFIGQTKKEIAETKKGVREALERDYSSSSDPRKDINNEILRDLKLKRDVNSINSAVGVKEAHTNIRRYADKLERHKSAIALSQLDKPEVFSKEDVPIYRTISLESPVVTNQYLIETVTLDSSLSEALANAKQLIDDIRLLTHDILEACEQLEASAVPADTFRVLAYDATNSQVVFAETTSSLHTSEQIRHPAEILLHINNPARFLPHFAKMKADGYEIISGGGDILIFRKAGRQEVPSTPAEMGEVKFDVLPAMDSREGSGIDAAVSGDDGSSFQQTPQRNSPKSRIVQRQEIVYTGGPPNWSPYPPTAFSSVSDVESESASMAMEDKQHQENKSSSSKIGRGIRRVILGGFVTAGTFYAIGVVCEYFITGGQDGLGPVGFTEFEAERRRRE